MARDLYGNIEERVEKLYASDRYKAFFLTGQMKDGGSRRAFVSVLPYNSFSEDELGLMLIGVEKLGYQSRLEISSVSTANMLIIEDLVTGTASKFPLDQLDKDVQQEILVGLEQANDKAFNKNSRSGPIEPRL